MIIIFLKSATGEVELVKGKKIKIVIDKEYAEKCDENTLFVDYPNIMKIVQPGSRVFIDDGLLSLIVLSVG
jgi:pyruvate kinase